jgi:hypothetical protein
MPLEILDIKGVPHNRRERIVAAVEAGGKHLAASQEALQSLRPTRMESQIPATAAGL